MPVLKTTSPATDLCLPKSMPSNIVPSFKISLAVGFGVFMFLLNAVHLLIFTVGQVFCKRGKNKLHKHKKFSFRSKAQKEFLKNF
jgi:hypothetical protein